jgi:hypothetical protein
MMLNTNRNSHLRATEILTGLLASILKDIIYKCGKIAYKWAKPSLIEYKNRVAFVFHTFAFIMGIESPLKYMLTI